MKYIPIFLLAVISCIPCDQREKDLEQILIMLLNDASRSASSSNPDFTTKKFVIGKLNKDHRDIKRVLNIDWESEYETRIPRDERWRKLVNEAVDIKNENDLTFEMGQTGEFFLIPIQESDGLSREEIDGVISFSELAFNEQEDRAVVYVTFICGGECGYGNLYFLSKENLNWKVVGNKGLWISIKQELLALPAQDFY